MFAFGNSSRQNLDTCDFALQLIMKKSLRYTQVDFGISGGYRSPEEQFECFKQGRALVGGKWIIVDKKKVVTYIDGYEKKGEHNYKPSKACDIYAYVPGKPKLAYNKIYLAHLGGVITSTANRLLYEGRINHKIRHGHNWDGDGEIGTDQTFQDMPHYEIRLIKT